MIDRSHDLPVTRQATLLSVSRGSIYYKPRVVSVADLSVMRRIDELHLDHPFAGSRMLLPAVRPPPSIYSATGGTPEGWDL